MEGQQPYKSVSAGDGRMMMDKLRSGVAILLPERAERGRKPRCMMSDPTFDFPSFFEGESF